MKSRKFLAAVACGGLLVSVIPRSAVAQSYGGSEYVDGPPAPPPPPVGELTKPPPPEAPPPSPGEAWQEDGYRDGHNGAPWGAPAWGVRPDYYSSPYQNVRPWDAWDTGYFVPWTGMAVRGLGYQQPDAGQSSTCVDQDCMGR